MSTRMEVLQASLVRKTALFDTKLEGHFQTVAQANGQPLNDKRNGRATLHQWGTQDAALQALEVGIQKTKAAIEREQFKVNYVAAVSIPPYLQAAVASGLLTQWRKFPRMFFITGVEGGRIALDEKTGALGHRHLAKVPVEQRALFCDTYNELRRLSLIQPIAGE